MHTQTDLMPVLYRPPESVAADFIPFFHDGRYHLFYLRDYRDEECYGKGTPWWHVVTNDFVTFEDWGEALPRGEGEAGLDLWVFTGSVCQGQGQFHIFYTGHNWAFQHTDQPMEVILHATSFDLRTWTKDETFRFYPPAIYEQNDWRDPFVFWHDEAQEYWMLLVARKQTGPERQRGCVALAASAELQHWEMRAPLWEPDLYHTHECPDIFRIGDWWYLLYSTYSDRMMTHYRMSRSLEGPWLALAAYLGRSRPPISIDADQSFRLMPTSHFGRCRPPLPGAG